VGVTAGRYERGVPQISNQPVPKSHEVPEVVLSHEIEGGKGRGPGATTGGPNQEQSLCVRVRRPEAQTPQSGGRGAEVVQNPG